MEDSQHIKLSELTSLIEGVIQDSFHGKTYLVIAEISGMHYYPEKNYYFFNLVEKGESKNAILVTVQATAWSTAVEKIKAFELATGQKFSNDIQVLVKVSVEYSGRHGLKLNFHDIDHSFTIGNLEKQRRETLKRLLDENPGYIKLADGEYVTHNQLLKLNPVIQTIALISSSNSEGHKDFLRVLNENQFGYVFRVDEYLTQVQGETAAPQMVAKLIEIYNSRIPYDAVVIVRGGGSPTDFLVFDTYKLSQAVARFPVPVITGIGHSGNLSIVDLMANTVAIAPTKAAEVIIARNRLFEEKIINIQKAVITGTNELTARHRIRLNNVNSTIIAKVKDILGENASNLNHLNSLILAGTNNLLLHHREELQPFLNRIMLKTSMMVDKSHLKIREYSYRLNSASNNLLKDKQYDLNYFINLVRHLSPANVLKRGYSLVYQDGKIVKDPKKLRKGSEITNLLYDTEIISTVKDKKKPDVQRFKL